MKRLNSIIESYVTCLTQRRRIDVTRVLPDVLSNKEITYLGTESHIEAVCYGQYRGSTRFQEYLSSNVGLG